MKNEKSISSEAKSPKGEKNTAQTKNPETPLTNPSPTPTGTNTDNSFMPSKTFILIGLLSLITIILVGIALYTSVPKTNPTAQKQIVVLKTTLSVLKPVTSASAYLADVTLTTERKKVTAVQVELKYDPKTLTNVDIKPGSFFASPTVLSKKIDKINGRISYILGIGLGQQPVNGNGIVAILSFTPLLKNGITTIALLPESKITVSGVVPSILTNVQGIEFSFGQPQNNK